VAIRKNDIGENLALIIDTHVLGWCGGVSRRVSPRAREAIEAAETPLFVSAVTAWEYADLWQRGRIPEAAAFEKLQDMLGFQLLDFPASVWMIAARLPNIHRDPADRMLIAHAISADLTLVTADADMRRYPVKSLW
jgi:PIN domain nuclease of toxin-antitoxin system